MNTSKAQEGAPKLDDVKKECRLLETALKNEANPTEQLERIEAIMRAIVNSEFGPVENVEYFLRTMLPKFILLLLKRGDLAEGVAPRVNRFFQTVVIEFTLKCVEADTYVQELLQTLCRLFTVTQKPFYSRYGSKGGEETMTDSDEDSDDSDEEETESFVNRKSLNWEPTFFTANITFFGKKDGFNLFISKLADEKRKLDANAIKWLLKPIVKLLEYLPLRLVRKIVEQLRHVVFSRLLEMSDEDLKGVNRKVLGDISASMESLLRVVAPKETTQLVDKFELAIAYKMFMSPYLEKRLMGLSDIKRYVDLVLRKEDYQQRMRQTDRASQGNLPAAINVWIDSKQMVEWLNNQKIMEQIYVHSIHQELLKRAVDIAKFFAIQNQIQNHHIDLMWSATIGKHESICHIIYNSLAELSTVLPAEAVEYLFQKIKTIPYASYDTHTFSLIQAISVRGINLCFNLPEGEKKWYGVDIWWEIIQDETDVPPATATEAFRFLETFLTWVYCHELRPKYIGLCMQNLKEGKSVPFSLKLLQKLLDSYPAKKEKGMEAQAQMIDLLEVNSGLMATFFEDLHRFKSKAKEAAKALADAGQTGVDLNQQALVGKQAYIFQIKDRLDFLEYILSHSPLVLQAPQIDAFWASVIVDALTLEERDHGFLWVQNVRNSQQFQAITEESTQYIFEQKVPLMDFSALTQKGFHFFEYFFRYVNWFLKRFDQGDNGVFRVLNFDLVGIDNAWRAAVEPKDDSVAMQAIEFLNKLHKTTSAELLPKLGELRERHVATCMGFIADAFAKATASPQDAASQQRIVRCLNVLKAFIEEIEGVGSKHGGLKGKLIRIPIQIISGPKFELEIYSSDTVATLRQKVAEHIKKDPSLLRIITAGKELHNDNDTLQQARINDGHAVHIIHRVVKPGTPAAAIQKPKQEEADKRALPSSILSKQQYFEQIFQLLALGGNSAQLAWDLLMMLPTNQKMLTALADIRTGDAQLNWEELLNRSSTFNLLYTLQIVQALMQPTEDSAEKNAERAEWCNQFLARGGVNYLVNTLLTCDFFDVTRGSKRKVCLSLLLKIINSFTIETHTVNDGMETVSRLRGVVLLNCTDGKQLVARLMELSMRAATDVEKRDEALINPLAPPPEIDEVEIVGQIMSTLLACCLSSVDLLQAFLENPAMDAWLAAILLGSPEPKIREKTISTLYKLSTIVNEEFLAGSGVQLAPQPYFLAKLLAMLRTIEHTQPHSAQYFDLLNRLLQMSARVNPSQFAELLDHLITMLKDHPTAELRNSEAVDHVLYGVMSLLKTLVSADLEFKNKAGSQHRGGLVHELFHKCLFNIPTMERHGPDAPPQCKTSSTRNCAFRLLTELADSTQENYAALADLLVQQHRDGEKRSLWKYQPSAYEKAACGYVGLKNLGATCYMNSLMQQFFMIPGFRWGMLEVQDSEEKKEESLLWQLQTIFGYLQESEKKYYDTRPFCSSYKDWEGQPMNVGQQQDADEFMNMLLDRLESILKKTQEEKLLSQFFGGALSNQIISKDCTHVSEREENFFTLSLDIKNKKSILESLALYVEGDMLEGDNKFHCSECNAKVDALKRCCVKNLPDNLIVHLKRFEFDLETMKRIKLNDSCQFPMILDMEPYTKEGLAKKEGTSLEDLPQRDESYYKYELAGILVHTGTADYGHYYSFIRERLPKVAGEACKWYQFNDTLVEPFDPEEIPKTCFGGADTVTEWDEVAGKHVPKWRAKTYNAYMLFYQRVKPIHPVRVLEERQAAQLVPEPIYNGIWEENMAFFQDKNIFDPDYFDFLWSVVKLDQSAPVTDATLAPDMAHPTMRAIELGTRFIVETLSHAKDKGNLPSYVAHLKTLFSRHVPASRWLLERLESDITWVEQLLLICPGPEAREPFASLLVHALTLLAPAERIKYNEEEPVETTPMKVEEDSDDDGDDSNDDEERLRPTSIVVRFLQSYLYLLEDGMQKYWKNFDHYFMVLRDFALIGDEERQLLLAKHVPGLLIDFYLGEESPLRYLHGKPSKKKRAKMGEKKNPPRLDYMVGMLSALVRSCSTDAQADLGRPPTHLPNSTLLHMPEQDKELIYSNIFWKKILSDGINPQGMAEIAVHLCWENEDMSRKVIKEICSGIDLVDSDRFKPYFEVLSQVLALQDSLHPKRIENAMSEFLRVIMSNLKFKMATREAIRYLVDVAPTNPSLRTWLYEHKHSWVETWLIVNPHEIVRDAAQQLIQVLVPGATHIVDQKGVRIGVKMPDKLEEADVRVLHDLFRHLLSLLPAARRNTKGDQSLTTNKAPEDYPLGYWKLTQYFDLLKWCLRGPSEKLIFAEFFDDFANVYIQLDKARTECDENKRKLMSFWLKVATDCDKNVRLITDCPQMHTPMFDFFASLNAKEKVVAFNEESLSDFYNLMHLCCLSDPNFLEKWAFHQNLDWAVKNAYLLSPAYPRTSDSIFPTLKLISDFSADYRQRNLPLVLKAAKLPQNSRNIIRYLDVLVKSQDDAISFIEKKGLEQISKYLQAKFSTGGAGGKDGEEAPKEELEATLRLLLKATDFMVSERSEKFERAIEKVMKGWEGKTVVLNALLSILEQYGWSEDKLVLECYKMIKRLCGLDKERTLLEQTLETLYLEIENILEPEPQSGGGDRPVVGRSFSNFVQGICSLAFQCFTAENRQRANNACGTALMLAIASTHLPPRVGETETIVGLLQRIWDSKTPMASLLKTNDMLPEYLAKVLGKDTEQLGSDEVYSFVKAAFPAAAHRINGRSLVEGCSLKIVGLLDTITSGLALPAEAPARIATLTSASISLIHELKALSVLAFAAPDLHGLVLGDEEIRGLLEQLRALYFGAGEASSHAATLATLNPSTEQIKALLRPFLTEAFPGWEEQPRA